MNDDDVYTWEGLEWEGRLHSQEGVYWRSSIRKEICGGGLGHVVSTELKEKKLSLVGHQFPHQWLVQRKTAALYF